MDHDSSSPPSSTTVGKSNSNIGTSTSVGTNFAPLFGDRLGSSGLTPGVSANAWETPPPSRHPASLADDLAPATSVLTVDDENALDLDIAAVMNSQLGSEGLPPTPEATTGKKTPAAAADDDAAAQEPAAKKPKYDRLECPPGELPPPPPGDCDPELEARLAGYRAKNLNPTQQIRANRDFNNPMLLQKIVDYYGIDDVASNYPTSVFDPAAIVARRSRDKSKKDEPAPAASRSNSPRPDEPAAKD